MPTTTQTTISVQMNRCEPLITKWLRGAASTASRPTRQPPPPQDNNNAHQPQLPPATARGVQAGSNREGDVPETATTTQPTTRMTTTKTTTKEDENDGDEGRHGSGRGRNDTDATTPQHPNTIDGQPSTRPHRCEQLLAG
ncbi:hypothetical protein L208DRAFT_1395839 [Tricholoma matsutake]|nr:hypothetical protein L208DRAFT_1395839 [Tricholoma matsutake 945]